MRATACVVLGLVAGLLAGCDSGSTASDPAPAPVATAASTAAPSAAPSQVEAPPGSPFQACLLGKGVRLPGDEREGGDAERMRAGVEACAALLGPGDRIRVPVVKGSAFQACLARNGVKLPAPGGWFVIDRREDRAMDAALVRCQAP